MPLTLDSVAAVLKRETAGSHSDAERILLPRLSAIQSVADYATILKTFYGYFFPLQEKIGQHIFSRDLGDIAERRHASLALLDLKSISQFPETLDICAELPPIENKAQAFGAMYVLEGSTLGGRVISKMLMKNESIILTEANLQFFSGYKEETGTKWKVFLEALNQQEDLNVVATSANATFLLFQSWIKRNLYNEYAN